MLWVLYSLLSAFSWATTDALTKKIYKVDDYIVILARFLYATPFVLLLLFFVPIPKLDSAFWFVLSLAIPIEVLAWVLYIKSIRNSPLSLVVPFLTLTPLFLVLTSFVILKELPTLIGFSGIFLIVVGAYTLNLKEYKKGILEPFKSIFKEKGCAYMVIVAFLFSITSVLGKILVQKSSPLFVSAIYLPIVSMPLIVLAFFKSRGKLTKLKSNFKNFFFIGLFFALMSIFHLLAIQLVIVPYMSSIKRTSSIFSVLYGYFIFKEKNIKERLVGTFIMVIGAVLIILF
ncbi:DMT family transporter [Candidatus Woesearchaeota archaeon]|nr:DMT family transporter [Candidatus Woesearchaeota archaeon]